MTKRELQRDVVLAFEYKYGFRPNIKDITILEASDDGYILCEIGVITFRVNKGKIERVK